MQFVESRHTPRITMLRAIGTATDADPGVVGEYAELVAALQVQPRLAELLADDDRARA